MKVSVIIPTLNRASHLKRALQSLVESDYDPKYFEIIIVDNGSTDDTHKISEQYNSGYPSHCIKYIYDDEPGMLTGRHRGAVEAKAEILTFIDDDIKADKGWLKAIIDTFNNPEVHLVGGRNLPEYEITPPHWLNWFWYSHPNGKFCGSLSLLDFGEKQIEIDPNFIWGLNFSIRKKTFLEVGGFHPDCIPQKLQHFQGDGETGLTRKIKEKGYKSIYQPKALVHHIIPAERLTYDYFDKRFFYQGVCDSFTYIRKHGKLNEDILCLKQNNFEKIKTLIRWLKYSFFSKPEQVLRNRFFQKSKEGYLFHHLAVKANPKLLEWVLKDNYFDYHLPINY